ncbi:hypothetical protein KIW84_072749 [Lathyrus oleraceus]|uniref:C2H2-type domain-containing protein n=1 Tax=Pisum sativum TaxID=3888 RepID=A0A9D4ZXY0_PEA|nr:hypothetical protein KIW84_072749 [Pisum sativum]
MEEAMLSDELPKFSDIRRYFCPYCAICRSKKTLITSHINSQHKEELEKAKVESQHEADLTLNDNTCEECGANFKKHAYLLQHMQSHSLECEAFGSQRKNSNMREASHLALMD